MTMMSGKKPRWTLSYVVLLLALCGVGFVSVYPLLYLIAVSFSSPFYVMSNQVALIPKGFTVGYYKVIFANGLFFSSYMNTLIYTVLGTAISVVMTVLFAYPLSRKTFIFRNFMTIMVTVSMFFSGGMIPNFLLVKNLGMYNTIWAIVLVSAISTYNLIICKTFFQTFPVEIEEAASMDGCNKLQNLVRIVLPLSMPVIAVMILFYAVALWNNYMNPLLYLRDSSKYPVQVYLQELLNAGQTTEDVRRATDSGLITMVDDSFKGACLVASLLPIVLTYPFLQKFFVKGVMLGSLKG